MLAEDLSVTEVRRMIDEGAGVDRLENLIERLDLDPDEEAALWPGAWSNAGRDTRQRPVPVCISADPPCRR